MAKLTKPPIPLKMYKHFAVVTLTLTAAIAMFADSDNREAMAHQVEERQQENALRAASGERFGKRELVRRDLEGGGSFGDEGGGYGAPQVEAPSSGGGRRRGASQRSAIPGYSAGQIAAMSESEYRALLDSLSPEERAATQAQPSAPDMAAIERASARRAGRSGMGADAPG